MSSKEIIGYKSFDKDFKCGSFQYEVGRTYRHTGEAKVGKEGFHFCPASPFDILRGRGLFSEGRMRRFARVSAPVECVDREGDIAATSVITIEDELSLEMLIITQVRQQLFCSPDSDGYYR